MFSFQGQSQLYGCKRDDFRMAIEEAFLAENGYLNSGYVDKEECSTTPDVKIPMDNGSDQCQESCRRNQVSCWKHLFFNSSLDIYINFKEITYIMFLVKLQLYKCIGCLICILSSDL